MIEVRDLVKTFEGFRALDGISLTVPKGGVYGLVGPNGSGKSTLLRHLAGVYRPDSGSVTFGGTAVYENAELKSRIAYIPDDLYHFTSASILDMKKFYRDMYPNFSEERYNKLKEVFELNEKKPIRRMSKGMQKQAAFWLAISLHPDYLLLDEPVDGLDPVMRRQLWSILMADLAEHGTTVLVSSHNLRELEDVCDHVGIIDHGKMLVERSLSQLQDTVIKVQAVFEEEPDLTGVEILHESRTGRLRTLILRSTQAELHARMAVLQPVFYDVLPLTLEEIFIYELGGADYAVKEILL